LEPNELESLLQRAEKTAGAEVLAAPVITLQSGRAALISIGEVVGSIGPESARSEAAPHETQSSESIFAVKAVGYFVKTNVTLPNLDPVPLVGPSLVLLPEVVGEKVRLTISSQITEGSNRGLTGEPVGITNRDGIRTNFLVKATAEISHAEALLIRQGEARLQNG